MEKIQKKLQLDQNQELTKQQRRQLKKQQQQEERQKEQHQRAIKKTLMIAVIVLVTTGIIFSLSWYLTTRPAKPESVIIAKQGIHWHVDLAIKISDQYQNISADIGIGITHQFIHTHEADRVIHLEFPGLVKENDIKLGRFFEIWNKKFSSDCIFDKCNGPNGKVKMLVNREPNFEFENYIMKDGDKIEIIFE